MTWLKWLLIMWFMLYAVMGTIALGGYTWSMIKGWRDKRKYRESE